MLIQISFVKYAWCDSTCHPTVQIRLKRSEVLLRYGDQWRNMSSEEPQVNKLLPFMDAAAAACNLSHFMRKRTLTISYL